MNSFSLVFDMKVYVIFIFLKNEINSNPFLFIWNFILILYLSDESWVHPNTNFYKLYNKIIYFYIWSQLGPIFINPEN